MHAKPLYSSAPLTTLLPKEAEGPPLTASLGPGEGLKPTETRPSSPGVPAAPKRQLQFQTLSSLAGEIARQQEPLTQGQTKHLYQQRWQVLSLQDDADGPREAEKKTRGASLCSGRQSAAAGTQRPARS